MRFISKSFKNIKKIRVLSFFILISIATILFLGYAFIEKKISLENIALILFVLSLIQILILQFFFKNELKNNFVKSLLDKEFAHHLIRLLVCIIC